MYPEIQIKRLEEVGVKRPSEEIIQEPARFDMNKLLENGKDGNKMKTQ